MTADHETSERVYAALKADLLAGRFAPGRLQITSLEARYSASATPVRETLLRLVGEALVEMRSTGGFALPAVTENDVCTLYEMSARMTMMAVAWRDIGLVNRQEEDDVGRNLDPPIDVLFTRLARSAGNQTFCAKIESLNDRMCRLRHAEQVELDGLDREFANLDLLVRTGPADKLRRALRNYHRRRLSHTAEIARRIALQDAQHLHRKS